MQPLLENRVPPPMQHLQMVDAELSVASVPADELPDWIMERFLKETGYDNINCLTFFYAPDTDVLVLNGSHKHADLYEQLIIEYLTLTVEEQRAVKENLPVGTLESTISLLDRIVERRSNEGLKV